MKPYALLFVGLMLAGCSPSRIAVQAALPLEENRVRAIQEERDPELAKQAIPANLKTLEGLLKQDPNNTWILENLAEGFCSYAFSFLEDSDFHNRCSALLANGYGEYSLYVYAGSSNFAMVH